jgi:Leucine-rich repeat (LRR) protein
VLNLSQNKIIEIPQCINKLESLEYFIIRDNNLETLPETILNMRSLKELDCRQNPRIKISESIRKKKGLDLRF